MGATIWVDLQGRAGRPEEDLPGDLSIMLRLDSHLDALAAKLGVALLSTFHDYSSIEADLRDEVDEADDEAAGGDSDSGESGGEWFDPAPALRSVLAIQEHLARHPDDLGFRPTAATSHWPDDLMQELEAARLELEDAASRGEKFRFLIVA